MTLKDKLGLVFKHIFSRKTIVYIILSFAWTMASVFFWNWYHTGEIVLFESMEITLTIMGGKLVLYGIWDYLHLGEAVKPQYRVVQIVTQQDRDDRFGEYCLL